LTSFEVPRDTGGTVRSRIRKSLAEVAAAPRDRDPALYTFEVARRKEDVTRSALFACKINWQTVLFLGCGDDRRLARGRGRI
jgi:hypothetical protein